MFSLKLNVIQFGTDYFSSFTVFLLRQDPSGRLTKRFRTSDYPVQPYIMVPHPQWHFSEKKQTYKQIFGSVCYRLPSEGRNDSRN